MKRINVSIDSLDPATYARITRGGDVAKAIAGVDAALAAGIAVKINVVALRNDNLDESVALAGWAHARGAAISFIEVMPLGDVEAKRIDQHVPMARGARTARGALDADSCRAEHRRPGALCPHRRRAA